MRAVVVVTVDSIGHTCRALVVRILYVVVFRDLALTYSIRRAVIATSLPS
jgi:hypothetical protein